MEGLKDGIVQSGEQKVQGECVNMCLGTIKTERLFLFTPSDMRRGNGQKLKYKKFLLNRRKNIFTMRLYGHWNYLPRETVESPFLELFSTQLDIVLHNML